MNNRPIDYGNRQYRIILHLWCHYRPNIMKALDRASASFEALSIHSPDTYHVLDRQGDVVEILMAACRGHCEELRTPHSILEWRLAYVDLLELCRSIDYVFCHVRGARLKIRPWDFPIKKLCLRDELENDRWADRLLASTYMFSVVVRMLIVPVW